MEETEAMVWMIPDIQSKMTKVLFVSTADSFTAVGVWNLLTNLPLLEWRTKCKKPFEDVAICPLSSFLSLRPMESCLEEAEVYAMELTKKKLTNETIMIPPSRKPLKRRGDPVKSTNDSSSNVESGKRRRKSLFEDDIESVVGDNAISESSSSISFEPSIVSGSASEQLENLTLQSRLNDKTNECARLVRKFETRLQRELMARKYWKAQMNSLESKLSHEQNRARIFESRACEAERILNLYQNAAATFVEIHQQLPQSSSQRNEGIRRPSSSSVILSSTATMNSSSACHASSAASTSTSPALENGNEAPTVPAFCVVCQTYTADTIIQPCGHICLCYSHVLTMQSEQILKICPLCKQICRGISRVHH
jgi:hypothetical protein